MTALTAGETYTFVVNTVNKYGQSVDSTQFSVLSAWTPYQPLSPTTQNQESNVEFKWISPMDGGSPITDYKITVMNFKNVPVNFMGECPDKFTTQSCIITAASMSEEPYFL